MGERRRRVRRRARRPPVDGRCKLVGLASGSVYRKQMGYACSKPYFTGIYCLLFRRAGDDIGPCLLVVALMSLIAPHRSAPSVNPNRQPPTVTGVDKSRSEFRPLSLSSFLFLFFILSVSLFPSPSKSFSTFES